ncbi:Piwi domain-containing protein [Prosthecobacter sp.]|jgi:hypothetical protein|uniref:argonaute/piwi family protein n=1 Tax=Prosthecobacter sp. TaxID=1965333 RepID=UPI003782D23C
MNTNPALGRFLLNCFSVEFSVQSITVAELPWTEETDMRELRKSLGSDWFVLRRGDKIYGLATVPKPAMEFGQATTVLPLSGYDGLDFMRARLNEALPELLPKYQAERVRPFQFLARKDEFVASFAANRQLPEVVKRGFAVRPRFELEARTIELIEGDLRVAVAISVAMQWEVSASLVDLANQGVQLDGLYVVLKHPQPGERRLVGRIKSLNQGNVELDETMDGRTSIAADLVRLEGSKFSFKRCLSKLLGQRYRDFEAQRESWEATYTSGPSFDSVLGKLSSSLKPVNLGPGIVATIGAAIPILNTEGAQIYRELPPVEYCFDAAKTKRKTIPWNGLVEFGPYDSDTFEKRTPRILVVVPQSEQNKAEQVFGTFLDGVPNGQYPVGFARLFNLRQVKFDTCPVADQRLAPNQHAAAYRAAIESHLSSGASYDAALVVVPNFSRQMPDDHNPYLHAKALLLTNGIPSQELRVATLHQPDMSLQYTLRNIAVSLYAKMDGAPWTVSQPRTYNDEIVIGMGMAEVAGSRVEKRQRHMGITTVFLGDGNFLLSNISKECTYDEYPEVLKASTKSILAEVKRRNGWQPGDRVRIVFHSAKPLKNVEIDELIAECVADVAGEQIVEFASLQVSQDHPFKIIDRAQPGKKYGQTMKGVYAPARGFVMQLGASTRLLATNGPDQIKRPLSPLPAPLLVHLHKRSTSKSLDALTEQILKFTSMTWRSTSPAAMPVTIYYSELIAELLARFRTLPDWSPALLNTKLRASKWFL